MSDQNEKKDTAPRVPHEVETPKGEKESKHDNHKEKEDDDHNDDDKDEKKSSQTPQKSAQVVGADKKSNIQDKRAGYDIKKVPAG